MVFDDGTVEDNIDRCILATGFQMHFPFLEKSSMINNSMPPDVPPLIPGELFNSTYHVFSPRKTFIPTPNSIPYHLCGLHSLPERLAPFPLMEAQAHASVRAFADPSSLDHIAEAADIIGWAEKIRRAGASLQLQRLSISPKPGSELGMNGGVIETSCTNSRRVGSLELPPSKPQNGRKSATI